MRVSPVRETVRHVRGVVTYVCAQTYGRGVDPKIILPAGCIEVLVTLSRRPDPIPVVLRIPVAMPRESIRELVERGAKELWKGGNFSTPTRFTWTAADTRKIRLRQRRENRP